VRRRLKRNRGGQDQLPAVTTQREGPGVDGPAYLRLGVRAGGDDFAYDLLQKMVAGLGNARELQPAAQDIALAGRVEGGQGVAVEGRCVRLQRVRDGGKVEVGQLGQQRVGVAGVRGAALPVVAVAWPAGIDQGQ